MTEKELLKKADLALSDLINDGGYMQPEQSSRFLRKMMDQPTLLSAVRTVPMRRPQMEINKIGFSTRMLRAAKNTTSDNGGPYDVGSRALAAADRYKPTTEQISLETSEVIAQIDLPYEVLEDNIEGGAIDGTQFENTILDLMAERAALDLEELLINGDTTSGDAYLALQDGVLKRATSNIVNHSNNAVSPELFANAIKALPTKYHRLLGQYKFYVPTTKEIDYRMQVAQRQTSLGDATLTGTAPVAVLGVGMTSASEMPVTNMLLTIPQNIIWGVQRTMRMEFFRDIEERLIKIVLTMRIATQIEEEDMVVKMTNVG